MAYRLEWSKESIEDIESIATYIEKDSINYAKSIVTTFFEKAELLLEFPKIGRKVPEFNDENIREIFVYSYRLIYKIYTDKILVVAIIHSKRVIDNSDIFTNG